MTSLKHLPGWLDSRSSGVLLHVTSLPGDFGIGNLGKSSFEFIDFLNVSGFRFWQICPVGPTGYGDSPYQVFSSSAGNPYLIDWHALIDLKMISLDDLDSLQSNPDHDVNYGHLYEHFYTAASIAFSNFVQNGESIAVNMAYFGVDLNARYNVANWLKLPSKYSIEPLVGLSSANP